MTGRRNISSGSPYEPVVGYSRAVRVGNQVFVAGTVAWNDERTGVVGEGAPYVQAKQAIANIERALKEAGATLADVVRTRIYFMEIEHFEAIALAHGEAFGEIRPACTGIMIKGLVEPQFLVEIEADAVIP
jgi:enamine deaminase RidA (YjgF/YER057c/UK114 family)